MNLRIISREFIAELEEKAAQSPRQRTHYNFHNSPDAAVQRLIVQLKRGTYIRPHRHIDLEKWEMALVLSGEVDMMLFNDDGTVKDRFRLAPAGKNIGLELPPQAWHSYVPVSDQVTFFEVKEGPYDPARMSQFAPWAPAEADPGVSDYLRWMTAAAVGERYRQQES